MQRADDSSLLWDGPDAPAWVACNQKNKTCYSKMSKADWYSSRRLEVCIDVFSQQVRQGLVNSTAVRLDICNLNNRMNNLCQVGFILLHQTFITSNVHACLFSSQVLKAMQGKVFWHTKRLCMLVFPGAQGRAGQGV